LDTTASVSIALSRADLDISTSYFEVLSDVF